MTGRAAPRESMYRWEGLRRDRKSSVSFERAEAELPEPRCSHWANSLRREEGSELSLRE